MHMAACSHTPESRYTRTVKWLFAPFRYIPVTAVRQQPAADNRHVVQKKKNIERYFVEIGRNIETETLTTTFTSSIRTRAQSSSADHNASSLQPFASCFLLLCCARAAYHVRPGYTAGRSSYAPLSMFGSAVSTGFYGFISPNIPMDQSATVAFHFSTLGTTPYSFTLFRWLSRFYGNSLPLSTFRFENPT